MSSLCRQASLLIQMHDMYLRKSLELADFALKPSPMAYLQVIIRCRCPLLSVDPSEILLQQYQQLLHGDSRSKDAGQQMRQVLFFWRCPSFPFTELDF